MPTCGTHRATRAHSSLDSRDHRIAPVHCLLIPDAHHHEPQPMELEVTPGILGELLWSRVPPITVDLDDDPSSDEKVDQADAGYADLRSDSETRIVQRKPHKRLGARARAPIREQHPRASVARQDSLEGRQLVRADHTHPHGAVEHRDGELTWQAPHTLRDRVQRADAPRVGRALVDQWVPVRAELGPVGERQGYPTAVGAPESGSLTRQPHLRQPVLRNPETEGLCRRGAGGEAPDPQCADDEGRRTGRRVHAAARADHQPGVHRGGNGTWRHPQGEQLGSREAEG